MKHSSVRWTLLVILLLFLCFAHSARCESGKGEDDYDDDEKETKPERYPIFIWNWREVKLPLIIVM